MTQRGQGITGERTLLLPLDFRDSHTYIEIANGTPLGCRQKRRDPGGFLF